MWSSPSPILTQLRTQLLACASLGIVEASIHYPNLSITAPEDVTADSLPAILLAEPAREAVRYAEGAAPLVSGTLLASFFLPLTAYADAGAAETYVRTIAEELGLQFYGIAWKSFHTALSSDPSPGARAAGIDEANASHRVVTLTIQYGLSP